MLIGSGWDRLAQSGSDNADCVMDRRWLIESLHFPLIFVIYKCLGDGEKPLV